jgi:D-alanyl-D-alanine carboxypeptidase/D-alanyl-D-alanine-endopeptidase (penicillin-binding protein 4)
MNADMRFPLKKVLIATAFAICLAGSAKADLAGQIDAIVRSQKKVDFSIRIIEADSGKTVYQHQAHQALVPASNMKIITSAAALKYLGPDYEYRTKVGLRGDTLVVTGSGDPLLGDRATDAKHGRPAGWMFDALIAALKRSRVDAITDIVVDSGIFDDQRVHPSWPEEELNRWYACEVSGVNFNDNCIDVTAENNSGHVTVSIEPQTKYVQIIDKVTPISAGAQAVGSYRTTEANRIIVFGKCKDKVGPFFVAIERPAAFFGFLVAENLAGAGINVEGQITGKALANDDDVVDLVEYRTSLADCLARCNKNSLGLAVECLLKTIAAHSNPDKKGGSWSKGRDLVTQYLLSLDIEQNEVYIDDGSGLSRQNRLSANVITNVLLDVYKSDNWELYKASLAVGGVDGTIDRHFTEPAYKGRIFGKTGYISGVRSFSGVCTTDGGDFIFSIIANNASGGTREAINDMAKAIIDSQSVTADR